MKIVKDYPPNYKQIVKAFPAIEGLTPVFAYGDTVYSPGSATLPYDLRVHEGVHMAEQERCGVKVWWRRYLSNATFRLQQEAMAYAAQYRVLSAHDKQKWIRKLAGDLAGPMYGNLVTFDQAKRLIRGQSTIEEINGKRNDHV